MLDQWIFTILFVWSGYIRQHYTTWFQHNKTLDYSPETRSSNDWYNVSSECLQYNVGLDNVGLDNLYDFLHWKTSRIPSIFIVWTPVKQLGGEFLHCSGPCRQYQIRLKKINKIKTFAYGTDPIFFYRCYPKHTYHLCRPAYTSGVH